MSSAKTIAKNTGFLFIAGIIEKAISFILVIIIARYLGDVGMGKYSFAFAYTSIFVMFADFGISTFMIREVARDKTKTERLFKNILALKSTLVISGSLLAIVIILLVPKFKGVIFPVFLAICSQSLVKIFIPFRSVFVSHERMEYSSLVLITERIFALGLGYLALSKGYGLNGLLVALIIAALIALFVAYLFLSKKFVKLGFEFDMPFWKDIIKNSMPFGFATIFMMIYSKTDTIMLSIMKDYAVTGWYNAASKITEGLSFFGFYIIIATFPAMSKFHHTSKDALKLLFKKTAYYLWVLAFPMGIGITLLANKFIHLMYKGQFTNSIITLKILIWAEVFIFLNYGLGYLLNSINKQKWFTLSTAITAILNLILNLALIPKFSYIGASIATLIAHATNSILLYYLASKEGYVLNMVKLFYKPVIAGTIMGISMICLNYLNILILLLLSFIIYFAVLILIKGFEKEELNLLKSFVRKD